MNKGVNTLKDMGIMEASPSHGVRIQSWRPYLTVSFMDDYLNVKLGNKLVLFLLFVCF